MFENIYRNKEQKATRRKRRMSTSAGLKQDEVKELCNTNNAFNQRFLSWGLRAKEAYESPKAICKVLHLCVSIYASF